MIDWSASRTGILGLRTGHAYGSGSDGGISTRPTYPRSTLSLHRLDHSSFAAVRIVLRAPVRINESCRLRPPLKQYAKQSATDNEDIQSGIALPSTPSSPSARCWLAQAFFYCLSPCLAGTQCQCKYAPSSALSITNNDKIESISPDSWRLFGMIQSARSESVSGLRGSSR